MSKSFEFDAPQFINFSDMDDPKADRFFDLQQEEEERKTVLLSSSKTKEAPLKKEVDAENKEPVSTIKSEDTSNCKNSFPVIRKVLHEIVNHQIQNDAVVPVSDRQTKNNEKEIMEGFEKLNLSEAKPKIPKAPVRATEVFSCTKSRKSEKCHPMITRLDMINQKSESKSLSRLSVNSLNSKEYPSAISDHQVSSTTTSYKNKSVSLKRNASPLSSTAKFISLAEQIEHFYKDTPDRYRSKPSKNNVLSRPTWVAKSNCLPKTPNLITKYRQRKINFPDEKQREEMELEEIKKHQIKAHPLNEKILMGPSLNLKVPIIKKPATIPQPFSLTEVKKKEPQQEPVFQFKAQPIPSAILQGPVGIPPKKLAAPTMARTPQIRVPLRFRVEVKTPDRTSSSESFSLPRNTKVEPFSFDARMKEMLQKKKEFVNKVIEEEKKSFNSFKAQPMPAFTSKNDQSQKLDKSLHKTVPQPFNLTQPKGNKSIVEDPGANARVTPFKAKPATVIHQKPFVPKLQKHEIFSPNDFHLNTEKRAAERQKFDEKIKQKEEELALILKLQKEEEERQEIEKMLEERKKLEFKAKPMPRYKAFDIHKAEPEKLTLPKSPMFSFKTKKANRSDESC